MNFKELREKELRVARTKEEKDIINNYWDAYEARAKLPIYNRLKELRMEEKKKKEKELKYSKFGKLNSNYSNNDLHGEVVRITKVSGNVYFTYDGKTKWCSPLSIDPYKGGR